MNRSALVLAAKSLQHLDHTINHFCANIGIKFLIIISHHSEYALALRAVIQPQNLFRFVDVSYDCLPPALLLSSPGTMKKYMCRVMCLQDQSPH